MKRIISIIMCITMIISIISCSSEKAEATDTAQTTAAEIETEKSNYNLPDLPDKNFDGSEFIIFDSYGFDGNAYAAIYTVSDGEDGEGINDAIYQRNLKIEELYGIKITSFTMTNYAQSVKKSIQAEDKSFDAVLGMHNEMAQFAVSGFLYNLYNVPELNLSAPWWDQNAIKSFSIANKLYFCNGDFDIWGRIDTHAIAFNKKLLDELKLENPYELVYANNWTADKFIEMSIASSYDLNGDSLRDYNDVYGGLSSVHHMNSFISSCDNKSTVKNEQDIPVLSYIQDKTADVIEKGAKFFFNDDVMMEPQRLGDYLGGATGVAMWTLSRESWFGSDHALFYLGGIGAIRELRNMETAFGILPMPKYSSEQKEYIHTSSEFGNSIGIPVTNSDLELAGYTLETFAAISSNELKTAFYDRLLKGKVIRDNESEDMLDIIYSSTYYDTLIVYGIYNLVNMVSSMATSKQTNFVSSYEKTEKSLNVALDKLVTSMQNLN